MQTENIEGFRLSPQQKHLWLLHELDHASVFCVRGSIEIGGEVDPEVLKSAVSRVVHRYEILNTTFANLPGVSLPVQVINSPNGLLFEEGDISKLSSADQTRRIESMFADSCKLEQGLDGGPLLRMQLLSLSSNSHKLLVTLPALCADSATLAHFTRELSQSYGILIRGDEEDSGAEPLQYADIAAWQNDLLESDDSEEGRAFWQRNHNPDLVQLPLPFRRRWQTPPPFEPACVALDIDPGLLTKIETLSEQSAIPASAFFLTCWQLQLSRLSGRNQFMIGSITDGRTYEELQESMGLLAKSLPFMADLDTSRPFDVLLRETSERSAEILEWQEYFSWDLFTTDRDEAAYFPVSFSYDDQSAVYNEGGATFSFRQQETYVDRFDLQLSCVRNADSLCVYIRYDKNRYSGGVISHMAKQFECLLADAAEKPQESLSALRMIDEGMRHRLLVDFAGDSDKPQTPKCIHHIIGEYVLRTPNATAVKCGEVELSYSDLDKRSNQLAHYLQKCGVGPDVLVGLCMEPCPEALVGIVGILKAGGAYLPLDPEHPADRNAKILADTGVSIVCTAAQVEDRLPKDTELLRLDNDWKKISGETESAPSSEVGPDNYAYVIYTSGTTGRPKGVPISHANLFHSTDARITYYKYPVERFLLLSSFAFDSSIVGIFWTLAGGGTLLLPESGSHRDPTLIAELISSCKVSHMLCLPSLYSLVLEEGDKLETLQTVIVAGEVCPENLVLRHRRSHANTKLFNEYGPTEGTVWATVFDCERHEEGLPLFIGKPIQGAAVYLLDDNMEPVPVGVTGEIYLGGYGIAKGYLKRPELTKQKFLPDPFHKSDTSRLYRTGDLARFHCDGNIEFLGRRDHQVKIRGYRIELDEIANSLKHYAAIRDAAVVARSLGSDDDASKQLVAYYILQDDSKADPASLREYLRGSLPDYMVPAQYVAMEKFPVTANGKVDFNALPEPVESDVMRAEYVAPRSELEQVLAGIWCDLLQRNRVGINDNFFDLGGHSIMVAQVVARIRDVLHAELSLRTIFDRPTVAELAEELLSSAEDAAALKKRAEVLQQLAELSAEEVEMMLGENE